MAFVHGGDIESYKLHYGREPLDFSANPNPLGVPESVKRAAVRAIETADRYPDPHCRALRQAIAAAEGIDADHIVCGNGAADLILRLVSVLAPRRAVLTAPTFSEYEQALRRCGAAIDFEVLREEQHFQLTEGILDRLQPGVDLLFLCEPNNPTGMLSDRALLLRVLRRCAAYRITMVVDECFLDFVDHPEAHTLKPWLCESPHLMILRAFTKLYGMAGFRLGYLLGGDAGRVRAIAGAGQPWPVSSIAQAAGVAALADETYRERTRALLPAERRLLADALTKLGFVVYPGTANYLLFYSGDPTLHIQLAERGILIRDCSGYRGLKAGYYRVAVRLRADNLQLIAALARLKEEAGWQSSASSTE